MTREQILALIADAAQETSAALSAMSSVVQRYMGISAALLEMLSEPEPDNGDGPQFLTYKQAAELLQVSRGSLYEKVKHHKIPFHYIGDGKTIRFKRSELLKYADGGRVATNEEIRRRAGFID